MSFKTYARSTDRHGKPCRQDVFTSVYVAVDTCCKATGTIPTADFQRKLIDYEPALVASLTTREKAVNLDQSSPVPLALVFKLTKQFPLSSIANTTSQLAITNHVSHRKVFDSYQAIFFNQTSSQLVQKVSTKVFNFGVYFSHFKSRFMPVVRVFGFPTQLLLRYFELTIQPIKRLWIGYLFAIAGTEKASYTRIHSNILVSWWKYLDGIVINQQRNEPSTRGFEFNGNARRFASLRKMSRPNYLQRFACFSQPELTVLIFKSRLGKLCRTAVTFFLEPRILCSFCPEISKSLLQMSQTLLQRYATNFIKKVKLFGLFPTGKKARGLLIVNSLLSFIPSDCSCSQSLIVDQTHTPHCPSQKILLRWCWVETKFVGMFSHASHFITIYVNIWRTAFPECASPGETPGVYAARPAAKLIAVAGVSTPIFR
jgi:hypothetical protein